MTGEREQQITFDGLGIAPRLFEILTNLNFISPTPIQQRAIPQAVEGKDLIGIAQTGTGKTLAFGVPMIQRIAQKKGQGLVLLPTRELALQVDETLQKIGKPLGLKTAVLIGGASMKAQIDAIRRRPHIYIGTPGRIIDHLNQKTLVLSGVSILVLDEADRMFDMGFAPQITIVIKNVPKQRQTLLFSATMPDSIVKLATQHMQLPLRIEVAPSGTAPERVEQELFVVNREDKMRLLEHVLKEVRGSVLIFSRTKHGARKICRAIRSMGHEAAEIHSDRSLGQRKEALEGFKTGLYRVLVATDIASRGIDVKGIELVLNYDIPENPSDYVHRIGRTGRAGHPGRAISFAMPDQGSDVREIEKLLQALITVSQLPGDLPKRLVSAQFAPSGSHHRPHIRREVKHGAATPGGGRPQQRNRPPRRFGKRRFR